MEMGFVELRSTGTQPNKNANIITTIYNLHNPHHLTYLCIYIYIQYHIQPPTCINSTLQSYIHLMTITFIIAPRPEASSLPYIHQTICCSTHRFGWTVFFLTDVLPTTCLFGVICICIWAYHALSLVVKII